MTAGECYLLSRLTRALVGRDEERDRFSNLSLVYELTRLLGDKDSLNPILVII
jgi:hypothetical protein